MKKNRLFIFICTLFVFTAPIFSQENQVQQENGESAQTAVEKKQNEKVEKSKKKKTERKPGKQTNKSNKKNYTGWIDTAAKDIEVTFGMIQLKVRPKLGTFNISLINDNEKNISVLSTGNEYTTTSYYLKYNKKNYKLQSEANIKTSGKRLDDGIQIDYQIADVADVSVKITVLESEPGSGFDMIKITATAVNKGNKKADIALKAVYDTVLGESDKYHFYTNNLVPIQNEVMYRTMQKEKFFFSKNNNAVLQILLDGADITPIESVSLANYATLVKGTWEPEMLSYRAFDNVLSYNNSAVGVIWPAKSISVDAKTSATLYFAFGTDGTMPNGEAFIQSKTVVKDIKLPDVEVPVISEPKVIEPKITEPVKSEPVVKEEKKQTPAPAPEPAKKVTEEKPLPNVKFDVNSLSKEQLSPEYIQNLLDRILELEENDAIVNREELLQLNAELDAILESLR